MFFYHSISLPVTSTPVTSLDATEFQNLVQAANYYALTGDTLTIDFSNQPLDQTTVDMILASLVSGYTNYLNQLTVNLGGSCAAPTLDTLTVPGQATTTLPSVPSAGQGFTYNSTDYVFSVSGSTGDYTGSATQVDISGLGDVDSVWAAILAVTGTNAGPDNSAWSSYASGVISTSQVSGDASSWSVIQFIDASGDGVSSPASCGMQGNILQFPAMASSSVISLANAGVSITTN